MSLQSENFNKTPQEVGFYDAIQPFKSIDEGTSGKITVGNYILSGIGDLNFYASPDIENFVDTSKFFENPRRVWVELSLPFETPEDEMEILAKCISINVDTRNQTLIFKGQPEGSKIVFDLSRQAQDINFRQKLITNPLIEDTDYLKDMSFEFTDAVDEVLQTSSGKSES